MLSYCLETNEYKKKLAFIYLQLVLSLHQHLLLWCEHGDVLLLLLVWVDNALHTVRQVTADLDDGQAGINNKTRITVML